MAARKNPAAVLQQKYALLSNAIQGRTSASSSTLAASFGLPIEEVRKTLRAAKVNDDG